MPSPLQCRFPRPPALSLQHSRSRPFGTALRFLTALQRCYGSLPSQPACRPLPPAHSAPTLKVKRAAMAQTGSPAWNWWNCSRNRRAVNPRRRAQPSPEPSERPFPSSAGDSAVHEGSRRETLHDPGQVRVWLGARDAFRPAPNLHSPAGVVRGTQAADSPAGASPSACAPIRDGQPDETVTTIGVHAGPRCH